jgi:hypothetical protein
MMRTAVGLCLVAFTTPVVAQSYNSHLPVKCAPVMLPDVAEALRAKHGELPFLRLRGTDGAFDLHVYVNPETQTWTILHVGARAGVCSMGVGKGVSMEPIGPSTPQKKS